MAPTACRAPPSHRDGVRRLIQQIQQFLGRIDIAIEGELLALEVAAAAVAAPHPTDASLRDRLIRLGIDRSPLDRYRPQPTRSERIRPRTARLAKSS